MVTMTRTITFAIPMNNVVIAPFVIDLFDSIVNLTKQGDKVNLVSSNDTNIAEARWKLTKCICDSYEKGDIQDKDNYIIWLDSDQCEFSMDKINKLIDSFELNGQFDVLSAVYYTRDYPPRMTPRIVAMKKAPKEGLYNFIENYTYGEIMNVDVVGMGMCVMRPGLLYDMKVKYGKSIFAPRMIDDEHMKGEDVVFCEHVKMYGGMLGVDTKIQIGHGFYVIDKTVTDAMRGLLNERKTIKDIGINTL